MVARTVAGRRRATSGRLHHWHFRATRLACGRVGGGILTGDTRALAPSTVHLGSSDQRPALPVRWVRLGRVLEPTDPPGTADALYVHLQQRLRRSNSKLERRDGSVRSVSGFWVSPLGRIRGM